MEALSVPSHHGPIESVVPPSLGPWKFQRPESIFGSEQEFVETQ
jgi:hypothetical protein